MQDQVTGSEPVLAWLRYQCNNSQVHNGRGRSAGDVRQQKQGDGHPNPTHQGFWKGVESETVLLLARLRAPLPRVPVL